MQTLDLSKVTEYVNTNIDDFHAAKAKSLAEMELKGILKKKNPYLFKAKNITVAGDLVRDLVEAFLYASEEKLFGNFLEDVAIFISSMACGGRKSSAAGIDLEFEDSGVYYVVSIKSGPNWGNSLQHKRQREDFDTAVRVLKQSHHTLNVQPVLGICYGKVKTRLRRNFLQVMGQSFWHLISGDEHVYTDIIEPLGYHTRQHNEKFLEDKNRLLNLFTAEFMDTFCDEQGRIAWDKIVVFNSGNMGQKKTS